MHKWQLLGIVSLSCIGLGGQCLASDPSSLSPSNDSMGCLALIKQGAVNPPAPTADLHILKICMDSCDQLYKEFGDKGQPEDMIGGSTYCQKSLSNLYFSSVAQTINDQLDQQTQQQQADQQQVFLDKVASMIKKNQQNQQNQAVPDNSSEPVQTTAPPANTPQQPIGPPDNIKW